MGSGTKFVNEEFDHILVEFTRSTTTAQHQGGSASRPSTGLKSASETTKKAASRTLRKVGSDWHEVGRGDADESAVVVADVAASGGGAPGKEMTRLATVVGRSLSTLARGRRRKDSGEGEEGDRGGGGQEALVMVEGRGVR